MSCKLPVVVLVAVLLFSTRTASAEVLAARVAVTGTDNATTSATVTVQTPGPTLFVATDPANLGDLSLLTGASTVAGGGVPFTQANGVIIATPNQFQYAAVGDRNMIETPGELTSSIPGGFPTGMWLSTTKASGAGSEANFNLAMAHFPFADGWIGGYVQPVTGTSSFNILAGNTTGVTITHPTDSTFLFGHYTLSIAGVDAFSSGMLFAQGTVNSSSGNVVPVGILPDNSGWDIRVNDEGDSFPETEEAPWSFVYVPYDAHNLIAGGNLGIDDATSVVVRIGVGTFTAERVDFGPDGSIIPPGTPDGINDDGRFLIKIPGKDDTTGYLMVGVSKYATASGVSGADDNFLTWEYNATLGGFLVESYDLAGASLQNSDIYFAYFDYDNPISLTANPPSQPGDFDGDGDVDGADFVAWQTNFPKASGATLAEGDADGDGDVDGADFVVWQTNFPFTPSPGTSPMPEPQSLLLAALAIPAILKIVRRKQNRRP